MEEKIRILKMIEDGTITADAAVKLLEAEGEYDRYMFRVTVDSPKGDKVDVKLPVGAVKKFIKAAGNLPIAEEKLRGIDVPELLEAVEQCLDEKCEGDIISVDAADGTAVRVFIGR